MWPPPADGTARAGNPQLDVTDEHARLFEWIVRGGETDGLPRLIEGFVLAQAAGTGSEAAALVREYGLPREAVSPEHLTSPEVWAALLPETPNALPPEAVPPEVKQRIDSSVRALQRVSDRPFVNKWPPNSVRVRLLADIFSDALFVRISRALAPTVSSILRGRQELCRRGSGWFSVKPPGYREIMQACGPAEQAAWQVAAIERALDADAEVVGAERFFHVSYEELTSRPRAILDGVAAFYERATGIALEKRCEIPSRFEPSTPRSH